MQLDLNDRMYYPVGIEIETHALRGLVMNLRGEILRIQRMPISPDTDYRSSLSRLVALYRELTTGLPPDSIMGSASRLRVMWTAGRDTSSVQRGWGGVTCPSWRSCRVW